MRLDPFWMLSPGSIPINPGTTFSLLGFLLVHGISLAAGRRIESESSAVEERAHFAVSLRHLYELRGSERKAQGADGASRASRGRLLKDSKQLACKRAARTTRHYWLRIERGERGGSSVCIHSPCTTAADGIS